MSTKRVEQSKRNAYKYASPKAKKEGKVKLYDMPQSDDYEYLVKEYRRLAHTADTRLWRLERYQYEPGYENVMSYVYKRAIRDIQSFNGDTAFRFNTKPPSDIRTLKAKMNDIIVFLNSPTSTKSGIKRVYQTKANTINEHWGTNFTWQDLAIFYGQGYFEQLDAKFGSATAMIMFQKVEKDWNKLKDKIETASYNHAKVSSKADKIRAISEYLEQSDITIKDLF